LTNLGLYNARLAGADEKSERATFFNEYVCRKINNIKKELIRKHRAAQRSSYGKLSIIDSHLVHQLCLLCYEGKHSMLIEYLINHNVGHPNLHHFGDWLQEASKTLTHAGLMSQRRDQPMESKSVTI
jgi:hypothetical protein